MSRKPLLSGANNRLSDFRNNNSLDFLDDEDEFDYGQFERADILNRISDINDELVQLEQDVQLIEQLYDKLISAFTNTGEKRNKLEELMRDVQRDLVAQKNALFEINKEIKQISEEENPDIHIARNQHNFLSQKLRNIIREFGEIQLNYKERYEDKIRRQIRIVKPNATEDEIERLLEDGEVFATTMDVKANEARNALIMAEEQREDLRNLEKNITNLQQMFIDVATYVDKNSQQIDQIDSNVKTTVKASAKTLQQVELAEFHKLEQRKNTLLCCLTSACITACCVLLLIIIIGVIILLMYTCLWDPIGIFKSKCKKKSKSHTPTYSTLSRTSTPSKSSTPSLSPSTSLSPSNSITPSTTSTQSLSPSVSLTPSISLTSSTSISPTPSPTPSLTPSSTSIPSSSLPTPTPAIRNFKEEEKKYYGYKNEKKTSFF